MSMIWILCIAPFVFLLPMSTNLRCHVRIYRGNAPRGIPYIKGKLYTSECCATDDAIQYVAFQNFSAVLCDT